MNRLISPSIKYKESFIGAIKESQNEIRSGYTYYLLKKTGGFQPFIKWLNQHFSEYIKLIHDKSQGKNLPPNYAPQTDYWLVSGNDFLGRLTIRHILNSTNFRKSGSVGLYIRPSSRGKGFGKTLLNLGLKKAKKMGLSKLLITCDQTNKISQHLIKNAGGRRVRCLKNMSYELRYWLKL